MWCKRQQIIFSNTLTDKGKALSSTLCTSRRCVSHCCGCPVSLFVHICFWLKLMALSFIFAWIRFIFAEILDAVFSFSFLNLRRHFRVSGDFRSPWKEEVDGDRKGLFSSSGPPTGSGVSTENLLMREWLSLALHFPVCVSKKYKWRSPYRQVCLPIKLPATKIC